MTRAPSAPPVKASCGYCNRRAVTVEHDGPHLVPVCREHVKVKVRR